MRAILSGLAILAAASFVIPVDWLLPVASFLVLLLLAFIAVPSRIICGKKDALTDALFLIGSCLIAAPAVGIGEPMAIALLPFALAAWRGVGIRDWKRTLHVWVLFLCVSILVWRPLAFAMLQLAFAPLFLAFIAAVTAWRWEDISRLSRAWLSLLKRRRTVFLGLSGGVIAFYAVAGFWRLFSGVIPSPPHVPWIISALGSICLLAVPILMWHAVVRHRGDASILPNWPAWATGGLLFLIITALIAPVVRYAIGGVQATGAVLWSDLFLGLVLGGITTITGSFHDHTRRLLMSFPFMFGVFALGYGLALAFVEIFMGALDFTGLFVALVTCCALVLGYVVFLYELWRD